MKVSSYIGGLKTTRHEIFHKIAENICVFSPDFRHNSRIFRPLGHDGIQYRDNVQERVCLALADSRNSGPDRRRLSESELYRLPDLREDRREKPQAIHHSHNAGIQLYSGKRRGRCHDFQAKKYRGKAVAQIRRQDYSQSRRRKSLRRRSEERCSQDSIQNGTPPQRE